MVQNNRWNKTRVTSLIHSLRNLSRADFGSSGGVVYNMLAYQSKDSKIVLPPSGLSDETLNRGPVSV